MTTPMPPDAVDPLPSDDGLSDVVSADPLDALVDGVRRGERDAIAEVYLLVAPALRGYLRRRVGHGEVADDLVEQTFLELIEGADRIRGGGASLRGWLFRAARHNLYDWRKRADRRSDHPLRPWHASTPADDPTLDPAEEVDAATLDPALERALMQLTEDQREVLELRLVAGLPVAEVAALTGRSDGAVKMVQQRALRRLGALLDDAADPAPPHP